MFFIVCTMKKFRKPCKYIRACFTGVHTGNAFRDQHVPYIRPQDSGGHTETQWVAATATATAPATARNDGEQTGQPKVAGAGFLVRGAAPFQFSVCPFASEALAAAAHDTELR